VATTTTSPQSLTTCRPLEWLNFFVADVQTGLGPFLAAYLAANSWSPLHVGYVLTFGGIVTVLAQTPVRGLVDWVARKRTIVAAGFELNPSCLEDFAPCSKPTVNVLRSLPSSVQRGPHLT
jgi:hypothetical protein